MGADSRAIGGAIQAVMSTGGEACVRRSAEKIGKDDRSRTPPIIASKREGAIAEAQLLTNNVGSLLGPIYVAIRAAYCAPAALVVHLNPSFVWSISIS